MLKVLLVIIWLILSAGPGNATKQDLQGTSSTIEKLKNDLTRSTEDTLRIKILLKLAGEYLNVNNTEAEKTCRQAFRISQNIRSKEHMAKCCAMLGAIKLNLGDYIEADKFLNDGLNYNSRVHNELINGTIYNNLGTLYFHLDDYDQALENWKKSHSIFSGLKNETYVSAISLNIGLIYFYRKEYDKALIQFSGLIRYFQDNQNTVNLISAYNYISAVYYDKNLPDSAEYYCMESLKLSERNGIFNDVLDSYHLLGRIYSYRNQYEKSNEYLNKALSLADTLHSTLNSANISESLSDNYAVLQEYGKAYNYLAISKRIKDSLDVNDSYKGIVKQEIEKQKRISESRGKLNYIALVSLVISIMLIVTVYYNFRIKKKANRLLVEMDELKSRLFSNLTHEFRTPLTLILGPLEEMLSEGEKRDLTRHEIKIMRKNANRLLNLVNQMLDLAKLDAKSLKAELSEADFVQFFKVNAMSFTSAAEQKGISYSWSFPKDPMITYFDEDKIEKIISNLISNALKYTGRGGEVKCGLERVPGSHHLVTLYVSDTGKGIRKENLAQVFDRFYQVEGKSGSDSSGTGIGLSLTKELVSLLHGQITAESEWGTGSKFIITLPLGYKHFKESEYILIDSVKNGTQGIRSKDIFADEEPDSSGVCLPVIENKDRPVVLTVEDQADIRNYISKNLRGGFRLLEAENGLQGFETAIKYLPDLIVTDLIMPEMDGLELCSKLKTDERTSHIPVIMLTARSAMEDKLKGLETGADQYLTKPFHMKEFKLLVCKLIEQRKMLRERFSRDVRLEPRDIAITSADERFLNRALAIIEKHMGDFDFEVNTFQKEMAMSRMQLFRKIKALSDQSPTEFIRIIRLKRAAKLIEQDFGNIAQICFEVGFSNPSYFAKCFKEMYGSLPSDYKKDLQKS